jgi:hypothetical protein
VYEGPAGRRATDTQPRCIHTQPPREKHSQHAPRYHATKAVRGRPIAVYLTPLILRQEAEKPRDRQRNVSGVNRPDLHLIRDTTATVT